MACQQKSLFIAVIVPPHIVPVGVWFDFLEEVLKCRYKNPDTMHTSPELGRQVNPAGGHCCLQRNPHHKTQLSQRFCPLRLVLTQCTALFILGLSLPGEGNMLRPFAACDMAHHTTHQDRDTQTAK